MRTLPGVGKILSAVIALEIGEVSRLGGPQRLTSYCGLVPAARESAGKKRKGRCPADCNGYLRWAFIEAANVIAIHRHRKQSTFERLSSDCLNRQQRRELARKLTAENPGLEIVNRNVAGIDVGNESHYVAVAPGCDRQPVREFGSWTADLERMAELLRACGVEMVVMQSTGVYWMALYDILEAQPLEERIPFHFMAGTDSEP